MTTSFPTMTLQEEFDAFLEDALYGTNVDPDDLLYTFCNDYLGIAYCDENAEEMMEAVVEEPFVLNGWADMLQQQADED